MVALSSGGPGVAKKLNYASLSTTDLNPRMIACKDKPLQRHLFSSAHIDDIDDVGMDPGELRRLNKHRKSWIWAEEM